jgi:hypothetical protein
MAEVVALAESAPVKLKADPAALPMMAHGLGRAAHGLMTHLMAALPPPDSPLAAHALGLVAALHRRNITAVQLRLAFPIGDKAAWQKFVARVEAMPLRPNVVLTIKPGRAAVIGNLADLELEFCDASGPLPTPDLGAEYQIELPADWIRFGQWLHLHFPPVPR